MLIFFEDDCKKKSLYRQVRQIILVWGSGIKDELSSWCSGKILIFHFFYTFEVTKILLIMEILLWINTIVLAAYTVFNFFVFKKQKVTIATLETTINAQKEHLNLFDPHKYKEHEALTKEFYEKKLKVSLATKSTEISKQAIKNMNQEVLQNWTELLSFTYHFYLKQLNKTDLNQVLNALPNNRELLTKILNDKNAL